jgi:hypothetical protein
LLLEGRGVEQVVLQDEVGEEVAAGVDAELSHSNNEGLHFRE